MTTYNVYQGNKKVLENAPADLVVIHTGVDYKKIAQYINTGKIYHGTKGEFTFDYPSNELEKKPDPVFEEQWDKTRFKLNPKARR